MKNEEQKFWIKRVDAFMKADKETEARERLRRVWSFLSGFRREVQIYELVCVWGFSQALVAERLGISQPAVNKALKKYFQKNPDKKPRVFMPKIKNLPSGFHKVQERRL